MSGTVWVVTGAWFGIRVEFSFGFRDSLHFELLCCSGLVSMEAVMVTVNPRKLETSVNV